MKKVGSLVDVRSREEFELERLPGAVNIPWRLHLQFLEDWETLPRPVFVYCEDGQRARQVVRSLRMIGFQKIHLLRAYRKAETPQPTAAVV